MKKQPTKPEDNGPGKEQVPANLEYPASEDIYNQSTKAPMEEDELLVKGIKKQEPSLDDDLDIPGAELDDADEELGEEDEENNYYSLGGDNHSDLDEN